MSVPMPMQQGPAQQALFAGDEATIASTMALLVHYYDLAPASARMLLNKWLQRCPADWARAAVIEALYQGRYRAVSVEQILAFWIRRNKLTSHFNREFEALIAVPLQQELERAQVTTLMAVARPQRLPRPSNPFLRVQSSPEGNRLRPEAPARARSPQMHQPPIDQFIPAEDPSGFAVRLQEVAWQFALPLALPPADSAASLPPDSFSPNSSNGDSLEKDSSETEANIPTSPDVNEPENPPVEDSISE